MLKKYLSVLLSSVLAMTLLGGCGSSEGVEAETENIADSQKEESGESVNLSMAYWHPEQKEIMEKINGMFMDENPNISIELQQIPGDQYDKILMTRILSDDGPDVYMYFGCDAYKYGRDGFLGDLSEEDFADDIIPAYTASCMYDGKLYAVPLNAQASCILYNKKVFENAGITKTPETYAEFLDICETLKKSGVTPLARGAKDLWTSLHETGPLYADFVFGANENFQKERYNETFTFTNSPEMKDYLEKYIELIDKGYIDKGVLGLNHSQAAQAVADGTAAMIMGLSTFYADIKAANPDVEIGYFPLPDEEGNISIVGASDKAIGYWPKGENIEEAKKLVAFYAKQDINKLYCDETQMLSCIKDVEVELDEALIEISKDIEQTNVLYNFLDSPWPMAALDTYRKGIQSIHTGNQDINTILADIDKAYDENKDSIGEPATK